MKTKNGRLFYPNSSGNQRSDSDQSQIIGGDAAADHTQNIGRDTLKLFGGYIPSPTRVSAPLAARCIADAMTPHNCSALIKTATTCKITLFWNFTSSQYFYKIIFAPAASKTLRPKNIKSFVL